MGIIRSWEGCFDITVETVHGSGSTHEKVQAYVIDEAGVHFRTIDNAQHFVPHQNITWFTIREHNGEGC